MLDDVWGWLALLCVAVCVGYLTATAEPRDEWVELKITKQRRRRLGYRARSNR